jgi:hypothetical protein
MDFGYSVTRLSKLNTFKLGSLLCKRRLTIAMFGVKEVAVVFLTLGLLQIFVDVDHTDSHVVPQLGVVFQTVRAFLECSEGLIPFLVLIKSKAKVK